ncbi:hypothetical protein C5167_025027 [Papaver somniferum]|uniref:Uncharacterized protein n=1 Tax=Papaver somniferum TaxID=3469 RepID=A0A4Y7JRC0_PAPSO|nr:hypothetical protein C5167_025027 [Papaver somniferum]
MARFRSRNQGREMDERLQAGKV